MSESQQADKPLSQRQEQLDRHIAARVEDMLRGLHERIGEQVRAANQELLQRLEAQIPELPSSFLGDFDISQLVEEPATPAPPVVAADAGDLLRAVAAIDGESGQAEILTALLEQGLNFSSRTAFLLIRQGVVRGWAGRGYEEDRAASFQDSTDAAPWAALLEHRSALALDAEAAASVTQALGGSSDAAIVVPFAIRGQISGALWAEREPGTELDASALQVLAYTASMALESAAVAPGLSPSLKLEGALPSAAPLSSTTVSSAPEASAKPEPSEPVEEAAGGSEPAEGPSSLAEAAPAGIVEPEPEAAVEEPAAEVSGAVAAESYLAEESPGVPEETAPVPTLGADDEAALPAEDAQTEYVPVEGDEVPSEDEIALEAEPEPELEDTNIWELEEEDEEDDEPTAVGMAVQVRPPEEPEPDSPEPAAAAAEAPPSPSPAPPEPIGQETVRLDVSAVQRDHAAQQAQQPAEDPGDETSPTMHALPHLAAPSAVGPSPTRPSPVEPSADEAPAPAPSSFAEPAPPPASFSASPPSFAQPSSPAPEAPAPSSFSAPPPQPEPEPESKPEAAGGSTEVVPPPDLDGPGLAFAAPAPAAAEQRIDEGEAALHEEARRLARLLVSEIKLYNEEIIEEGRRSGNIYERLKDDIDRSRQMYEERIDPRLADQEDYFYQELVQRLAGGEERLLGM